MRERVHTIPPVEIFDVIDEAETKGIRIPDEVKVWWATEAELQARDDIEEAEHRKEVDEE